MTPLSAAALTNARRFAAYLRMVSLLIEKVAGDGLEGGGDIRRPARGVK